MDKVDVVQQTLIQLNEQIEGFDCELLEDTVLDPYSLNCRVGGAAMRLGNLGYAFYRLSLYFTLESSIKPFTATLVADQGHFIRHVVSAYFGVVDTDLLVLG